MAREAPDFARPFHLTAILRRAFKVCFVASVGFGASSAITPMGTITFDNGDPSAPGMHIGSPQALSRGGVSVTIKGQSVSAAPHMVYAVYPPAPS